MNYTIDELIERLRAYGSDSPYLEELLENAAQCIEGLLQSDYRKGEGE